MLKHVQIRAADHGPRVRHVMSEKSGTLTIYLRAGMPVDQHLCDLIADVANWCMPYLEDRPPLSYQEAADALGVSTKWLYRRVKDNSIPYTMVGKRVRFLPEHIWAIKQARVRTNECG